MRCGGVREREKRRIGSLGDQQVTRDAGVGQPANKTNQYYTKKKDAFSIIFVEWQAKETTTQLYEPQFLVVIIKKK